MISPARQRGEAGVAARGAGPRRVLYLQATSEIGGSDVALLRLVESLDRRRFCPYVALPADGPLVGALKERGCAVFVLRRMLKLTTRRGRAYHLRYVINYPAAVAQLARLIRRERIDLVHTNSLHNLYGFAAAALAGRPHLWHVREIVLQSRLIRRAELFLARHFARRIIVISDAVAEMFADGAGRHPARLTKIPDGVDLERFRPDADGAAVYQDLGIEPGVPLVGLACRLDHWKGVETFLRAAALCRAEGAGVQFLVAGGAVEGREDYAERMLALAGELKLGEAVHFTGWRYGPDAMPQVFASLAVAVLASSWPEPLGLVVLEAMAAGRPVVATNHGGPREVCVDGETALLVPPREPRQMARAILTLLRAPERARAMGAAGRRRAEQLYDQRRCAGAVQELYREVLAEVRADSYGGQ